ncbi:MAG: hypothetical protein AAFU49_23785 [Pseudomonadota bacterium]
MDRNISISVLMSYAAHLIDLIDSFQATVSVSDRKLSIGAGLNQSWVRLLRARRSASIAHADQMLRHLRAEAQQRRVSEIVLQIDALTPDPRPVEAAA